MNFFNLSEPRFLIRWAEFKRMLVNYALSKHVLKLVKIFALNVKLLLLSYRPIWNDHKEYRIIFESRKLMTFETRQFSLTLRLTG